MEKDFVLLGKEPLLEEDAELLTYRHQKTGAQVLHLKNADPNKLFAIGFRTPPLGSTGNCHILEHAVLNGSRKYRAKEPFMEAVKSSLQTFLNAATYPDKTMYPIASRNEKDFYQLMDLYLDAVFYPRVLEDQRIFRQEGWRRELLQKDGHISYQGVVYNEMKGAMSTPDRQVSAQAQAGIFPGTIYAENAGGDPRVIPSLSYQDFCRYHQDYYHPSNAMVFLYGDLGQEALDLLASYFNAFSYRAIDSKPKRTQPFSAPRRMDFSYSLGEGENEEKKDFLSMSWLVDQIQTGYQRFYYAILEDILVDSESSPLRRRLLEELGAQEVYASLSEFEDVAFHLFAKNVEGDQADRFQEIVLDSIREMAEKGVDPMLLEGALNRMEFSLREKQGMATKGIVFADLAMTASLYDRDAKPVFHYAKQLADFRKDLAGGGFTDYLKKHLLENPHRLLGIHRAQAGKNAQEERKIAEDLAAYQASLSEAELSKLIQENQDLRTWQRTEDRPEVRATIPSLGLEDLPKRISKPFGEKRIRGKDTYLLLPMATGGICYLSLAFDPADPALENLPYLMTATTLLGRLDTDQYDYPAFELAEDLHTGGISIHPILVRSELDGSYRVKILVETKILTKDKLSKALELMGQEMVHTSFKNRARLQEVLGEQISLGLQSIIAGGSSFAVLAARSHVSLGGKLQAAISGLAPYFLWKDLAEKKEEEKFQKLEAAYAGLFSQEKRQIVLAAGREDLEDLQKGVEDFLQLFPARSRQAPNYTFSDRVQKEAFVLTSDVGYHALAGKLTEAVSPALSQLATNLLSNDFLYRELRAKGGAYGQFASFARNGDFYMASYRDSRLAETYRAFQKTGAYLKHYQADRKDWIRMLIGSYGSVDVPLTDRQRARKAMVYLLMDRDESYDDQLLEDLVQLQIEEVHLLGERLEKALDQVSLASFAPQAMVEEEKDFFDRMLRVD